MNVIPSQTAPRGLEATVSLLQEELEATNREVLLLTLELEQRVAERTAQLAHTNQGLLKEVAERVRAEMVIKRLNKDLAHRAELLEAANEELEAFSASVSHDLRNPLARMLGFGELLKDAIAASLNQKHCGYLEKICIAGTEMAALIDDLLRLSRAAHVQLAWTSVDLNDLVEKALEELDQEMQGRNILWRRTQLPVVSGDSALLQQVFLNLISNALKYSRPRDPAEIEIAALRDTSEEWIVLVRDNGVGFDPQRGNELFGAFQRLHSKNEFEGTGIGLANVRRIVLRHGGRVWAEGQAGQGAAFYFSLPMLRETEGSQHSFAAGSPQGKQNEVLLKKKAGAERRVSPRHASRTPLRFRTTKSSAPEENAIAVNLSTRGVFFATSSPLEVGTPVEVLLQMPAHISGELPTEWHCSGQVVRVEPLSSAPGKVGIGVRFDRYEIKGPSAV